MKILFSILALVGLLLVLAIPAGVLAAPPAPLGGLWDLSGYCISQGFVDAIITKPDYGPNAAFNNWRCLAANGKTHPFSMEQACKWHYGINAIQAHPTDRDDAFSWVCYSVGSYP